MEKYKSVKILGENYGLPTKAEVTLEDETTKVVEGDELWALLYNFATQEGYESSYEFMKNSNKFIKKEEIVESEKAHETDETAKEEETEKTVTPVVVGVSKKDKKAEKTKKKSALRIGAGIVTIVLLISGGAVAGYAWANRGNGNTNSNSSNKPKKQYIQMVDYPEDEKDGLTNRVEVMATKDEAVREELIGVVDGKAQSEEELEEFLSNQEALAWTNVTNISRFINGQKLTGDIYRIDFKSVYDTKTVDYPAVEYFEELRNNIVNAAYETNSVSETKNAVTDFNQRFIKFVFGNNKFKYNDLKTEYTWDDLSPSAQNTILAIGMGVLTIEHDFSVNINNQTYNRLVSIEKTYDLKQEVYEEVLESQNFHKKNSK